MNDKELEKEKLPERKKFEGKVRDNLEWLKLAEEAARERINNRRRRREAGIPKVIIADVHFSTTDETYYVSNGNESLYSSLYRTDSIEKTMDLLKENEWKACGQITRNDYSPVDMWQRNTELIAIWVE